MADITKPLVAALCYETCRLLADRPEGFPVRDIHEHLEEACSIPESLKQPNPNNPKVLRFHYAVGFNSLAEVKAGWLVKDGRGNWRLTDEGRGALERYPDAEAFHGEAGRLYDEWDRLRHAEAAAGDKQKDSWSSAAGTASLIGRKKVDWSIFEYGTTIPAEFHADFDTANERHLDRGERVPVDLVVDDQHFDAFIANWNQTGTARDSLQIRYDANHRLKQVLRERFRASYEFIRQERDERSVDGKKPYVVVPDDQAEYIDFLSTGEPFRYQLSLVPLRTGVEILSETDMGTIWPSYSLKECADATGIVLEELRRWKRSVERKGQAILYGPPGTGKTFVAEHLARHLVSEGNGLLELVQFHPAYTYEDFIEGIRPRAREDGSLAYPMVPGRFLDFCERAAERNGISVLIVDEINRANLSEVFGELMYLLEYRDKAIALAGGAEFRVPGNVRILGTMNTADRSIALVDYALRRRFAFLPLYPNYEILERFHQDTGFDVSGLVAVLEEVNRVIADPNYAIGVTFFLVSHLESEMSDIWQMEIFPYLQEYFFDQPDKVNQFAWDKVKDGILV